MKHLLYSLLLCSSAFAHDPGISNVTIELGVSPLVIHVTYAIADLVTAGLPDTDEKLLTEAAAKSVEWRTDKFAAPVHVRSAKLLDKTTAEFVIEVPRTAGTFQSTILTDMPAGHRQLLVLRDHAGEAIRIQMLSAKNTSEVITLNDLNRAAPPAPIAALKSSTPRAWWYIASACLLILGSKAVVQRPFTMRHSS